MTTDDAGAPTSPDAGARPQIALAVPALLVVVALAGGATMVVELGAVRLLAPWFGTSSSVWTNVIGVVLAALALGYALGARLATGARPLRVLGIVLLVGALIAAWLPALAPRVGDAFMPTGVALHGAAGLLVWGSLAAATVLFLPAATALGCAAPLAVEVLQRRRGGAAGRAGGHVLAASTLGSLAGTFGTTHVFVPWLGISKTFVFAAAVLAGCGAVLLGASSRGGERSHRATLGIFLLVTAAGAALSSNAPRSRSTVGGLGEELARADSALQSLRVVEKGEGAARIRYLQVNESLDSYQSIWQPEPGLLPPGHYYDHFALPYAWTTRAAGAPPATWDMMIVGLGAGTTVRVLEGVVAPETELRSVGVEIDPVVVELGREWFDLEDDGDARIAIGGLDGRAALRLSERTFDQVVMDAYANNMEIPPHLASVEAFRAAGERLVDGGWLTVNVGGFGPDDPVVRAVAAAAAVGLDADVHVARVPFSRNLTLFARKGAAVPRPGEGPFGSRGAELPGGTSALIPPLAVDGAWSTLTVDEARTLAATDDTSAMEHLQLLSIRTAEERVAKLDRAGNGGAPPALAPPVSDADADLRDAAGRLARDGDLMGAFEAAGEIADVGVRAATTAELMWSAGDLFGALEVATAGLAKTPGDPTLVRLAAELGLALGAADFAGRRVADLRSLVERPGFDEEARFWSLSEWAGPPDESRPPWANVVARLETQVAEAEALGHARSGAVSRARWVALLCLVLVGGAVVWVSRHPLRALS